MHEPLDCCPMLQAITVHGEAAKQVVSPLSVTPCPLMNVCGAPNRQGNCNGSRQVTPRQNANASGRTGRSPTNSPYRHSQFKQRLAGRETMPIPYLPRWVMDTATAKVAVDPFLECISLHPPKIPVGASFLCIVPM